MSILEHIVECTRRVLVSVRELAWVRVLVVKLANIPLFVVRLNNTVIV